MKHSEWLDEIHPRLTRKGARLDLRLYVYPDGHGNVVVTTGQPPSQPVGDPEEAAQLLRDLWEKAARAQGGDEADRGKQLEMLLSQVTPDNLHEELDSGEAVGREIW